MKTAHCEAAVCPSAGRRFQLRRNSSFPQSPFFRRFLRPSERASLAVTPRNRPSASRTFETSTLPRVPPHLPYSLPYSHTSSSLPPRSQVAVAEPVEDVAEDVEEAVAEEEEQPIEIEIATAPIDGRFPGTNQARACFVKYNEAHKCMGEKGEDDSDCKRLARDYRAICPVEWLEKWNEARDEGAWFGKY